MLEAPRALRTRSPELWLLSNGGRCPITGWWVLGGVGEDCGCLATEVKAVPGDEGTQRREREPGGSVGV